MVEQFHHDHPEQTDERKQNRKSLTIALIITTLFMIAEVIGGILSNSLALLSDALHMLSDAASLGLSLFAMWVAQKPPTKYKTFGYYRFEILAAFINGVTLIVISLYIYVEAYQRFLDPPQVKSVTMITIALLGLLANLTSAWFLLRGETKDNLNIRSAFLHVVGDILGSMGAILAGILILTLNWQIADPIISAVIATLVLISGIRVTRESLHVLMEGTPRDIALESLVRKLREIRGVEEVHELHIWTITSGFHSLSCHIVIPDDQDDQEVLEKAKHIIQEQFGIYHTTIQIERPHK